MGLWPAVLEGELFLSLVFTFCLVPPGELISLALIRTPHEKSGVRWLGFGENYCQGV